MEWLLKKHLLQTEARMGERRASLRGKHDANGDNGFRNWVAQE